MTWPRIPRYRDFCWDLAHFQTLQGRFFTFEYPKELAMFMHDQKGDLLDNKGVQAAVLNKCEMARTRIGKGAIRRGSVFCTNSAWIHAGISRNHEKRQDHEYLCGSGKADVWPKE